ncbi:MAG: molybdate ABC transporter substrate-binding protein [Gaiellales bacterium]
MLVAALSLALVAVPAATAKPAFSAKRADTQLTILAAASLNVVLPQIDPTQKYSFAGSDALQAQIALGAPADLFLAASTTGPDALYASGKCQQPVTFITNKLVLVVPASNPRGISSVYDLEKPGVRVIFGIPTVPIGVYTRQILRNLGLLNAITPQVVSQEKDVATIAAKLKLGAGDAGFVYQSDAVAAGALLTTIPVPSWAQPPVKYEGCVVSSSPNATAAAAYLAKLNTAPEQAIFKADGFLLVKKPAVIVKHARKQLAKKQKK